MTTSTLLISKELTVYSSHGEAMDFVEFIEIEVDARDNYTPEEIEEWISKYDLSMSDAVIWVTDYDTCKSMYCEGVEPIEVEVIKLITESDDGDNGFLAII